MHFTTDIQTIHLGHIDELHYVSTVPFNFLPMSIINNTVLVRECKASRRSEVNDENPQMQPNSLKDMISKFHKIVNKLDQFMYVAAVTNYGISIVSLVQLNREKEVQM